MADPVIWGQVLVQGIAMGGIYALLACGLTLMYALTKQLNVAHGDFLMLCMYICLVLSTSLALDPYLSLLITIPLMACLGCLVFW